MHVETSAPTAKKNGRQMIRRFESTHFIFDGEGTVVVDDAAGSAGAAAAGVAAGASSK